MALHRLADVKTVCAEPASFVVSLEMCAVDALRALVRVPEVCPYMAEICSRNDSGSRRLPRRKYCSRTMPEWMVPSPVHMLSHWMVLHECCYCGTPNE